MKRPWQIWLLFALGLVGVGGAFAWLTVKALELDQAESLARRQAELEEDISRALWRMDTLLTPLLVEEAARPEFVYRAAYPAEQPSVEQVKDTQAPVQQELSPLLTDPPEYVLLHFEIHPDGRVTSPQCPAGADKAWVLKNGVSVDFINSATSRLTALRPALSYAALLAQLPTQPVQNHLFADQNNDRDQQQEQFPNIPVIENPYEELNEQLIQQQAKAPNAESQQPPAPPANLAIPPPQQPVQQEDVQHAGQGQGGIGSQPIGQQPSYGNTIESGRLQRPQSRAGNDLINREAALRTYAQKAVVEQRSSLNAATPPLRVVRGISRPLWVADRLVLARRVERDEQSVIQGCWLDWQRLKERLRAEVADLLPEIELTSLPAAEPINLSRLLATIPVQLSVPLPQPQTAVWTPIRASLAAAWACLAMTVLAAAMMLQSVVALSERRGAFVSAVTHELRTPLTTFRMYAEMLSVGMVTDTTQRQRYLDTLRIEADRLAHLVENVLQFARLERGRPGRRREEISLARLLDGCESRLADRAAQAEMKLAVEIADADREATLATDSAAVEQILFNLVDNACKYAAQAADKRIHLSLASQPGRVQISVRDHGPGISAAGRRKLFQPFSKSVDEAAATAPGVGLGLALSHRLAADLGGRLELQSPADGGAAFALTLPR